MTDRIDTAALRRAHGETTQGEWAVIPYDCGDTPHYDANGSCPSIQCESADCAIVHWDGFKQEYWTSANGNQSQIEANARFIALAHEQWPALLEEIERLRGALRPFAALADKADELRHDAGSTCTWRLSYDDIAEARTALGEPMPPPPEQGQ